MWTNELILRLQKYIEGNRYFLVYYQSHRVFGIDLPPDEPPSLFPNDASLADETEFYLEEYDDARPDGVLLSETEPSDFKVYLLKPVEWQQQDPDWSEADPETWEAYVKAK